MKKRRKGRAAGHSQPPQFLAEGWLWELHYEVLRGGVWKVGQVYAIVGDKTCALQTHLNWQNDSRYRHVVLGVRAIGPWEPVPVDSPAKIPKNLRPGPAPVN